MVLSKLQFEVYAGLYVASLTSAPSACTVFRWFNHFSGENSGVQGIKSKMKIKTNFEADHLCKAHDR